ncbi:MAG: ABC transporter ATP-binding protein [Clostridia bacterium]|jgi:ABC-type sugar transport system ATPase subunit|nr:ABC transporter ATP-binding protein [Clostridia bacterium]
MNITAKYLTKVYNNGVYALDGFTADIKSGEFVAVLGASGCGKTTLLRLFAGLEKPTAGELYFNGVLFKDLPISKRDTAIVFQEYVLYPKMTVWENVAVALERYDLTRAEEEKRVYTVLSGLGLIKFRNQLPRNLSGGQQQRVALARALVRRPSLVLFDEPLSNIAPEQREEYISIIKSMKAELPRSTFIYVTHNPREAMSVGDKLLIMGNGRLLQYGEKERVWKNPYCADVLRTLCADPREFVGSIKDGAFSGCVQNGVYLGDFKDNDNKAAVFDFQTGYGGSATVILNAYDNNKPYLFDSEEKLVIGERELVCLDGEFDGKTLKFANAEYAADEDFRLRFIGEFGKVTVAVASDKIRFKPLFGDIKIPALKSGSYLNAGGSRFCLYSYDGFDGFIYINPADVSLYDGKMRVLAHYRVYKQSCPARISGGKLRMRCGALDYKRGDSGAVTVSFDKRAYITPVKKGGLKAVCLAEEDLGGVKLVYLALKGFEHYAVFYSEPENKFFSVKNLRISVAAEGVSASRGH